MVVAAAAEALEAISGETLGYEVARWKQWHSKWLAERPKDAGPSVAPDAPGEEPVRRPVRGLVPRFYGLPLAAKDLVFVVDVSGSVGSGGIERAKQELADAVERLPSDVRVAALFFSETVSTWRDGALEPATPANKEDLRKFLRGIAPGKRTDVFTPLNAGLAIVDRRVREKTASGETFLTPVAMVVVSDGEGNVQATPPRIVADRLERLDPTRTVVHAVVLGSKDSALMAQLAHMGGGHYLRASRD
jgi:Mg-chelatase subunit ChlD